MSFDSDERSIADGAPQRLYLFQRGTQTWCYTSGDRDVPHLARTYKAIVGGIADDGIRQTGQAQADLLQITAPADLEVAQLYRSLPPSADVSITVFALHRDAADYVVIWSGSVRSVKWPSVDRCAISCATLAASLESTGLRLSWDRACPHALYTVACGVNAAAWRVASSVQSMTGASVTNGALAAYPAGYFTGGYVEWDLPGGERERRGIERHTAGTLFLLGGTAGISLGAALQVYPGCAQTTTACKAFSNLANFGGIPHLAGTSPFDGNNHF